MTEWWENKCGGWQVENLTSNRRGRVLSIQETCFTVGAVIERRPMKTMQIWNVVFCCLSCTLFSYSMSV